MTSLLQPSCYTTFIGIDVHKKSYALSILDRHGNIKFIKMSSNPSQLATTIKKRYDFRQTVCAYAQLVK